MSTESNTPSVPLSSLGRTELVERLLVAERALRDITRCDYRGNEPSEQMIARLALADIERVVPPVWGPDHPSYDEMGQ